MNAANLHKGHDMSNKVWFITGASRGFGRVWTEAALKRGDKVAATARSIDSITHLSDSYSDAVLPLTVDVTRPDQVKTAVQQAYEHFGRLDVVLNNAGYALVGAIEEADESDIKAEFDVNLFGALRVIQAALPILRRQESGHIIGVSSVAGLLANPISGFYSASKWAFEAMHDSLAQEVAPFGIKVTMLEPGAYATEFASQASLRLAEELPAYSSLRQHMFEMGAQIEFGDPEATAEAVLRVVDSEKPPLRVFLGTEGLDLVPFAYEDRIARWRDWEKVSTEAQGSSRSVNISR